MEKKNSDEKEIQQLKNRVRDLAEKSFRQGIFTFTGFLGLSEQDVFWQEEDGIVVLDYKTDRVESAAQLIDRYEAQLRLYGEALERIFAGEGGVKLPVKERLLYSFRLGEVIPIV